MKDCLILYAVYITDNRLSEEKRCKPVYIGRGKKGRERHTLKECPTHNRTLHTLKELDIPLRTQIIVESNDTQLVIDLEKILISYFRPYCNVDHNCAVNLNFNQEYEWDKENVWKPADTLMELTAERHQDCALRYPEIYNKIAGTDVNDRYSKIRWEPNFEENNYNVLTRIRTSNPKFAQKFHKSFWNNFDPLDIFFSVFKDEDPFIYTKRELKTLSMDLNITQLIYGIKPAQEYKYFLRVFPVRDELFKQLGLLNQPNDSLFTSQKEVAA